MGSLISGLLDLLLRMPLWAGFAVPILLLLYFIRIAMVARGFVNDGARILYAALGALLLAPLPLGMWLVLIPNGYFLLEFDP